MFDYQREKRKEREAITVLGDIFSLEISVSFDD
jgi:hypothetical protein